MDFHGHTTPPTRRLLDGVAVRASHRSMHRTNPFCQNTKPAFTEAARVPYACAGRRTSFIVSLVYSNGSVPLGAAPEALRALREAKCTWARRSQFSRAARVSAARDPSPASTGSRRLGHRPAALRGSVSSTCAATSWLHVLAARRPPRDALNLAGAGGQSEPETKTRDILAS